VRVAIIGGGASGLMCGGFVASYGHKVTIFDGNEKAGKKIYITGKGRCNFTNVCDNETFLNNIVRGKKFMFSSLNFFSPYDTLEFFENLGMEYVVERGNRAFPKSNKASDVTKALLKHCDGVEFCFNEKVVFVAKENDHFTIKTEKDKYVFDAVVVATGGKSYEATGSKGDGYAIAKSFGHKIVPLCPALVPIELSDDFVHSLQGLSLKNVRLCVETEKQKHSDFGEMMFTDRGITGPIVLSLSSLINRDEVKSIYIDLKPALTEEQIENRLLREFKENSNKNVANVIRGLLPASMVEIFLSKTKISCEKKCNSITTNERKLIINNLKRFTLKFKSLYNLNAGVVTSGGVDLSQVNPKNMESKLKKNLFFIGEVLDIDALTGGFNLQIAFSTAYACAKYFKEL